MFRRLLCLILAALLVCGCAAVCSAAEEISRVSCCVFGSDGRGFSWFTKEQSGSDVALVKTADFDGSFANAALYSGKATRYRSRYSHHVSVTGLAPGTGYTYRVGDKATGVWSAPCSFVTDNGDSAVPFLVLADVQAGSPENFAHAAQTMAAALETLPQAEFFVNLGDYVNDNTNEEWDWYFDAFAFANDRLTHVPVAGNHDGNITNKLNTFCFPSMFCLDTSANRSLEGVYYSFDWGSLHFTVLNTNDMYPMSQAQRNWFVNDVTGSDARWKIVLMHRSLYSAGKNINKPLELEMRSDLLPLMDKLKVDLVLSGHDHMYLRTPPLRGDRRVDVTVAEDTFGGETFSFWKDAPGTVYALPSTAGTKRYSVNENALPPILSLADRAFSTGDLGGCFAAIETEGDKLIYKAYCVNDETRAVTEVDRFALMKTAPDTLSPTKLDASLLTSILAYPFDLCKALGAMLLSYLKLLVSVSGLS